MNNPNNVIRNMFNKDVSLWNFALLMSTRSSVDCLEELRVAGFTERALELNNGAYQIPWFIKQCIAGRSFIRPDPCTRTKTCVFQIIELLIE